MASTQQAVNDAEQQGDGRRESVLDRIACCVPVVAIMRTVTGAAVPSEAFQTSRIGQTPFTSVSASRDTPATGMTTPPTAVDVAVNLSSKWKSSASFEKSNNFIHEKAHKIEIRSEHGQRAINIYDDNNNLIAHGEVLGCGSLGITYELKINEVGYESVVFKDTAEGGQLISKALQREILGAHAVDYGIISNISEVINCEGDTFTIMEKYEGTLFSLLNSETLSLDELKVRLMPGLDSLLATLRSYDQDPTKQSTEVETYRTRVQHIDQESGEAVQGVWNKIKSEKYATDLDIHVVCDDDNLSALEIRIYERGDYTSYVGSSITDGVKHILNSCDVSKKDISKKLMSELDHTPIVVEPLYLYLDDLGLSNLLYRTVSENGMDRIEVVVGDSKAAIDKKDNISMEAGFFRELRLQSTKFTVNPGLDGKANITLR